MSQSGYVEKLRPNNFYTVGEVYDVAVDTECVTAFNELKLGKQLRYIIYKLSDDYTKVVIEEKSDSEDWDAFRNKLLNAKAAHKGREGAGPRFAVYDFKYTLKDGAGDRNKLTFISWSPDEGTLVQPRMIYASSKEGLKKALNGLQSEVQANREDDLEYNDIVKDLSKGTAAI